MENGYRVIDQNKIDSDTREELEFSDYIRGLSGGAQMKVFQIEEKTNRRGYLDTFELNDIKNDDIQEMIKNNYGPGKYFIQCVLNGKFDKGTTIIIASPKMQNGNNNFDIQRQFDDFKSQMKDLLITKKSEEDSEQKFLEKLKLYKEVLGGGGSSGNVKEMIEIWKEGIETGKMIENPQEKESSGFMSDIMKFLPLVLSGIQRPVYQPEIKAEVNPIEIKKNIEPKGEEEMIKIKYIGLGLRVRMISNLPDGEDKDQKCETVAFEIIDFFPELLQYLDLVSTDESIEALLKQNEISVNELEKATAKKILEKVKELIKDGENAGKVYKQ